MTDPRQENKKVSKINQPPRGLQDFLGNVNQGINPHELDHRVAPGVDLVPFWGVDKIRMLVNTGNVTGAVGQGIELAVPAGEVWIPIAVSGDWFLLTTEIGRIALHMTDPAGNARTVIAKSELVTAGAGTEAISCGLAFPQRFVMPTGWKFRCQVETSTVAGAQSMSVDVMYYRLRG